MICWSCSKEIYSVIDLFNCDVCDITLCRQCYSEHMGLCEECSRDREEE